MSFELTESSVLRVCKTPIHGLVGLADHYFLSEFNSLNHSLGWGPNGLEVRGRMRTTSQEMGRVKRFMAAAKYNICLDNCEHFANYVLYGLNLSSQQGLWWKNLGASVISLLQPTQSVSENYHSHISRQISEVLNENLRQAKIERANRERIEFWKARGIEIK
ncbi:MAG: hypothetical protein Fur0042_21530 [Cyanophyceae cyanobacterium]